MKKYSFVDDYDVSSLEHLLVIKDLGNLISFAGTGFEHNCALYKHNKIYCHGNDLNGQSSPPKGIEVEYIDIGGNTTCVITIV